MANEKNLKPIRSKKEAREKGRQGGIKSGETRKKRKTLREELLLLLAAGNNQNKMSLAMIEKAMKGDTKAFEVIRDTIGEKPREQLDIGQDKPFEVNIKVIEKD